MSKHRFESNAALVALLTGISRVTGLLRDAAISRIFGAGGVVDAFFFAFMVPNLFRRLFGEGALAAAFLPQYTRLDRDDPETARRLASMTIAALTALLGIVVLIGELVLFAISAAADHSNLAVWLMMIMLPYMPLVCLVAVLGAMLHTYGRFGPTAAAPIVLNICMIAAAVGLNFTAIGSTDGQPSSHLHIGLVAGSVLFAGAIQLAWHIWVLRKNDWWIARKHGWSSARPAFRQVLRTAGPMILGLGVLQLNTFIDGLIASYPEVVGNTIFGIEYPLSEGAMASISFAQRLYQFPLGVFGIAIATAIFPVLAAQSDDDVGFIEVLRRGLRLVVFIGIPASVGLIIVREPLTAVLFQGGEFTAEDTQRVSFVLLGYASGVWAYSMIHVLTRAFYARDDSMTPVKIAVSVVALNVILNCTLIWTPLREAGLGWSTAICAAIQTGLLLLMSRRRTGRVIDRSVLLSWAKTLLATAIMTATLLVVLRILPERELSWGNALLRLGTLVASGLVVMLILAWALRMPIVGWLLRRRPD